MICGKVLNIPFSHTNHNGARGNVWLEYVDGNYSGQYENVILNDEEAKKKIPSDINIKYYLTTWNNTAMIQTGHSMGNSTEDERKVLANTLFYLKQLTNKTEIMDNSARDIADPNRPNNVSLLINEYGESVIKFNRPEDNGSRYEYYEKGLDGSREFTSDVKSAEIKTGVKKYRYYITNNENENRDRDAEGWTEVNSMRWNRKYRYWRYRL